MFGTPIVGNMLHSRILKKNTPSSSLTDLKQQYIGNYQFTPRNRIKVHKVIITDELELSVDGKPISGTVIELSKARLVIEDKYGYKIIIRTDGNRPISILDETDDELYTLVQA